VFFQIIHVLPPTQFRHTRSFLELNYSDDLIILEITFISGRPKEKRLALLKALNDRARSSYGRVCARYGVLVVGEEMKGLVNCNFLPGSARRLELGTVSAEPLSRGYWAQK